VTFDVVDLYAGPGGWDEGMKMLGLTSVVGLEWDHAACLTATKAGHRRIRADVADYSVKAFLGAIGVIGSPPCQGWSTAGSGLGELDRARVHALVDAYANGGNDIGKGWADPRSHHAAQPVRWVRDLRPRWVALEQVPPVLGLWQHVAERLSRWGYSTWTGILNAADYGVPQTRTRAILIARLDGPALPPPPTHAREPLGPDLFGTERLPWVSMAEALQWPDDFEVISNYGTGGDPRRRGRRNGAQPAATVTSKADRMKVGWSLDRRTRSKAAGGGMYPTPVVGVERPAPTVTGQAGNQWVFHRPATTVLGDPRIGRPGKDRDGGESQFEAGAVKVTATEASVLQSFRPDYPWHGTLLDKFTQIGNAVPPLLAAHIIGAATGRKVPA
jgi:DNA (cytosine-5)-methyltransferase 1